MLGRFAAVVFDMDGVLLDSEPLHYEALRALLGRDGFELGSIEYEEFIGTTSEAMFATLIARHALGRSVAEYIGLYDPTILDVLNRPHEPLPGVRSLISRLQANARLALASSSRRSWIDATLCSLGLSDAFELIVSGDDVTHGKPDPEIYLKAADHLGIDADRCLAIEDSPNGVLSAHRAGMSVLAVRTPYTAHLALEGATWIVDSLSDPLDCLRPD